MIYPDSVTYFGEKIKEVSELGVRALGGCCGTTPEYIGEIYRTLFQAEHTLKFRQESCGQMQQGEYRNDKNSWCI